MGVGIHHFGHDRKTCRPRFWISANFQLTPDLWTISWCSDWGSRPTWKWLSHALYTYTRCLTAFTCHLRASIIISTPSYVTCDAVSTWLYTFSPFLLHKGVTRYTSGELHATRLLQTPSMGCWRCWNPTNNLAIVDSLLVLFLNKGKAHKNDKKTIDQQQRAHEK